MSTVKTNAILDASGGTTATVNGYTPTASNMAGRNRIINGNMAIWQRGTSFTPALSTIVYTIDRWFVIAEGAAPTISQTAADFGPYYSSPTLTITGIASNTETKLYQRIESANSSDLAGQTVTFSFWAYQTTGTTQTIYQSSTYANTTTDNFGAGQTAIDTNAAMTPTVASGVWTQVSCQIAIPTVAVKGIQVILNVGTNGALGSGQTFSIGKVQLEKGSTATDFEYRPYSTELALCQRYTIKAGGDTSSQDLGMAVLTGSTNARGVFPLPVVMRSVPTFTLVGAASSWFVGGGSSFTASAVAGANACPTSVTFDMTVSGGTSGQAAYFRTTSTTAYAILSAEL